MKKILASIMVFSLAMSLLTACGSKQNMTPTPSTGTAANETAPQATDKTQVDTSKFIGEEKAKEIALKKAETDAENVKFDRVELDYDDGLWQDERGNLPYKDTTYAKYLNSFSGYGNVTGFYNRENGIRPSNAVSYCTIPDYFVMRLCGLTKPLMHSSDAASFGCYNIKENKFDYDCNADITQDYCVAGEYKGIPLSGAIGYNQASVFSTLADENNILLNIGTGSQVLII